MTDTEFEKLEAQALEEIDLCCAICRCEHAMTWFVPGVVWRHYIPPEDRGKIICFSCWKGITTKRDNRAFEARHGRPVAWPGGTPMEWETGERMPQERWATHWPRDYPSLNHEEFS